MYEEELYHHGIKGQRWGIRRYQNPDGSLTAAGRKRYDQNPERYKKDLAATESRESAVTALGARKQAVKSMSKQNRMEIKEFNKTRSRAARAAAVIVGGPFINTSYSDFLTTSNSKAAAVGKTLLTNFIGGGIGHYAVQRVRQTSRAKDEYDREHPNSSSSELRKQKAQAEADFKRKQ